MMSWVMSNADLAVWPSVALVLFFAAFVGVVFRIFSRSKHEEYEKAARIPLDDERNGHE